MYYLIINQYFTYFFYRVGRQNLTTVQIGKRRMEKEMSYAKTDEEKEQVSNLCMIIVYVLIFF